MDRPGALNEPDVPRFHGADAMNGWKHFLGEVHAAGGRMAPQLWHVGTKRSEAYPDWVPSGDYEGPSGLSLTGRTVGEPMREAAVGDTIDAFARAASEAERIGFDRVELHDAHSYLIAQFFSDRTNRR